MASVDTDDIRDVRETAYLDADFGPPEDTETFYRGTPAPGQREHYAAPVRARDSDASGRVPRAVARGHHEERRRTAALATPVFWGGAAIATVASTVLLGWMVATWFATPAKLPAVAVDRAPVERSAPAEPTVPAAVEETDPPRDAKWQGIQVKKGLR